MTKDRQAIAYHENARAPALAVERYFDANGILRLIGLPISATKAQVNEFNYDSSIDSFEVERRGGSPINCGWVRKDESVIVHPTARLGKDVIVVGENVFIGENATVEGEVVIESDVFISKNVTISSKGHPMLLRKQGEFANLKDALDLMR